MGYWVIIDEDGRYVGEADTYEQAIAAIDSAPISGLEVIPYYLLDS